VLIAMIAAAAHVLSGDATRAAIGRECPRAKQCAHRDDFCRAFPMKSDAMRVRVLQALAQLGF